MINEQSGETTIGNENGSIVISANGLITIRSKRGILMQGIAVDEVEGRLPSVAINAQKIALGDVDGTGNQTLIVIDDEQGSLSLNSHGNAEPAPPTV